MKPLRRSIALLGALLCANVAPAQELTGAALRAAFIYNFTQFITWPEERTGTFAVCAYGHDDLGPALDALNGRRVRQMSIAVSHTVSLLQLADCQLVYLPRSEHNELTAVLKAISGKPVLLVADIEAATQLGAGVALTPANDNRLAFQLNIDALRQAELTVSSRLVKLARRVY